MKNNFSNKKYNKQKLLDYGFKQKQQSFVYKTFLEEKQFELTINVDKNNKVTTKLIDTSSGEPYTLHLIEGIAGTFIGNIRCQYENILKDISQNCFENNIFKTKQAAQIIDYARKKYSDELEYLWEKFPDNAICRRKDNKKWYFIIMTISKSKLGFDTNDKIEVIDVRAQNLAEIVDNKNYFEGYHMNKKHWITIILDDKVSIKDIQKRIDDSYILAKKS